MLEFLAAGLEGKFDQRFTAIVHQEIEDDEGGGSGFAQFLDAAGGGMNAHEEGVKGELSVLGDDDLAIEDEFSCGEGGEIGGELWKIAGERLGGLRHEIDAGLIAEGEAAEAVPLGLVLPVRADGEVGGGESFHGGVGGSKG